VIALVIGIALAEAPACDPAFDAPPESLSVAWVSPLHRHAGWMDVVPTAELRAWIAEEKPGVGRLLQRLGDRKKATAPHRRFKVTVFEVRRVDLCRPVDGDPVIADVAICENGPASCGYTVDRASGDRGFDTFRIRWRDAAVQGFCVLPADRFVAEGG
jgi:hypothetical protein